jgi:hypothetical protein
MAAPSAAPSPSIYTWKVQQLFRDIAELSTIGLVGLAPPRGSRPGRVFLTPAGAAALRGRK